MPDIKPKEGAPEQTQISIETGNVQVITLKLLSEGVAQLRRIADALESQSAKKK